jgi:hypothetical protein
MVHVRPHFSLCAPAYGKVGRSIGDLLTSCTGFNKGSHLIEVLSTNMAGGNHGIETNNDLDTALSGVLADPLTKVIVMAAAVCDFEPHHLENFKMITHDFGKTEERLSSQDSYSLTLIPSAKILQRIKQERPDIFLVSFKTTSDEDVTALISKSKQNMSVTEADVVFGNDIKRHFNLLVSGESITSLDRSGCVSELVGILKDVVEKFEV